MTEADCKLITEKLLGEKWHNFTIGYETGELSRCSCGLGGYAVLEYCAKHNRTFQDPQDFFACFEKLVELGEIRSIFAYACVVHVKERGHIVHGLENAIVDLYQWLNSRTESGHYRLCCLIAEWLKEKEQ
jgi:hypothetical protein